MAKARVDEGTFHDTAKRKPTEPPDTSAQEKRFRESLREAQQSEFEVFEDRGPGVSVPPAGMARRDEHGRR
ncbi:MAG: hypothetical protein QOH48_2128 [Actinomycetota bacterium]|jgi:hypothetical protein|nr:hypothetical protein [Actinomycetota bacterium]